MGTETLLGDGGSTTTHLLDAPECRLAVVNSTDLEAFIAELNGAPLPKLTEVTGIKYAKSRKLSLELYVLESSRLRISWTKQ